MPGGWADESTWPAATEQAVATMQRLYAALAPAVRELREGLGVARFGPCAIHLELSVGVKHAGHCETDEHVVLG